MTTETTGFPLGARVGKRIDALLRSRDEHAIGSGRVPWIELVAFLLLGASLYGSVLGAWNLRPLQMLYSALKVPILLGGSAILCLPSFVIINTLLGLRGDLTASLRGVIASQATVAVVLASLAPLTVLANLSLSEYQLVTLFNGVQFAVATGAGHVTLSRHYAPLVASNRRHRIGKLAWLILYVFVAVQMAWVLRPFIGTPGEPTQFFREETWGNAYIRVYELIRSAAR